MAAGQPLQGKDLRTTGVELGCGHEFAQRIRDPASIQIDATEGRVHARGNLWLDAADLRSHRRFVGSDSRVPPFELLVHRGEARADGAALVTIGSLQPEAEPCEGLD